MTLRTTYIAYHGAERGYQPDRSSAKPVRDRLPEDRGDAQDHDLNASNVGSSRKGDAQIHGKLLEGWNDPSCNKGGHHGMKRNKD